MKKVKPLKNAHTSNSKFGMGDFYGTGSRNPIGKNNITITRPKKPKSLA